MFYSKNIGFGNIYCSDLMNELEHFFTTKNTNIDNHRQEICDFLGITDNNLINPCQTHSDNIAIAKTGVNNYPNTDAIILTNTQQAVYLRFADCTPIILYDKQANIASVIHAGWRGTVNRIVAKTLQKMIEYSGSDYKNIFAAIGPAIDKCCYCVGDEVIEKLKNSVTNYSSLIYTDKNKTYISLKQANAVQLTESGLPQNNIDICPYCTSCRTDLFYSYRKENGTDGRHNALIKLKTGK